MGIRSPGEPSSRIVIEACRSSRRGLSSYGRASGMGVPCCNLSWPAQLAEQLADRLAGAELDGAAGGGRDVFLGWIQAEGCQNGGVYIFDVRRPGRGLETFGVGAA